MAGTTSATALAVSALSVVTGDEQDEQLTVTVSGAGGTPTGTVTVAAGATTVCTITLLDDGTGSCAPTADEFPVGPVTLTASYSGDDTFESSASPTASFEVTSPPLPAAAPTTTTLKLSKAAVTYGDEQAERISVRSAPPTPSRSARSGQFRQPPPSAQFSLSSSGTGSCALAAAALPPGTAQLTASYAGNADLGFAPSVSAAEPLTIAKEPTTTTVSLSAAKVTYGAEQRERISVAVKPASAAPTGQVTVKAGGTTIRVIALTSGKGTYTLAGGALAGGTVKLTASYVGDTRYARSSSAPKNLAIARTSSKTTLGLSAAKVSYGAEQRTDLGGGQADGVPAGHVTVKAGSAVICVITLRSAKGTCSPAPARLAAGRHAITAVYGGSGDVAPSVSAARSLSVAVASSTTTLSLSKGTVTYGSERSEKISVKVAPRYTGTPGGTVTVKANGATLAVIRLKSGVGSYTFSANRLRAGDYSLTATYSGNADFGRSVSAKRSLTVASPPPPPPPPAACHPLSSKGTCYEPGEYCSDADHGVTGVAGNGEAIVCEDNDGWRWEPVS